MISSNRNEKISYFKLSIVPVKPRAPERKKELDFDKSHNSCDEQNYGNPSQAYIYTLTIHKFHLEVTNKVDRLVDKRSNSWMRRLIIDA